MNAANIVKVAVCEDMLRVNREDPKHPFVPPTAIDWLGNGYTAAIVDALRAACGGGPVVILEDGTLATLKRESDETEAGCVSLRWSVVPVGES